MRAKRRRLAAAAALALGAAVAFAIRRRRERVVAPAAFPPPAPPVTPPVVLSRPPVAAPVAPALVPEPAPPLAAPRRRLRRRTIALAAAALVVLAAGVGASFAFRPGFSAQVAQTTSRTEAAATTRPTGTVRAATTTVATPTTTATTTAKKAKAAPATLCVQPPSGWQWKWMPVAGSTPPALLVTNFRFGVPVYAWGLLDPHLRWTHGGVMIAVADWTKAGSAGFRRGFHSGDLHVRSSDIGSFGAFPEQIGHRLVRVDGRFLELWVEARPPTSAAFAAANNVLGRVHTLAACR